MEREIKFRAWDFDRKEMIYFGNFKVEDTKGFWKGDREVWQMSANFGRGNCDGFGYFHDDFSEKSNVELMQFTGLKDKNGKDIYEGDIVECKKTTSKYSYKFTSVVTMQYGCFGVITDRFITLKDLIEGNIKIIGNIHESPELLNN